MAVYLACLAAQVHCFSMWWSW